MDGRKLTEQFEKVVEPLEEKGLSWAAAPDTVYRILAEKFGVSPMSIMFALSNEGLAEDPRGNS